jgi:hypothetical protein
MDIDYIMNGKAKGKAQPKQKKPAQFSFKLLGKPLGIIGDRVTKPQRKVLKSKNINTMFGDWDRDGVINGLDCAPRNKKKHMAWSKDPGIPIAEGDYGPKYGNEKAYEKNIVLIPSDKFLRMQYEQSDSRDSFENWKESKQSERFRIDPMKKAIASKTEQVPMPIILYDRYGNRQNFQEGAGRGISAEELGQPVPTIMARKKLPPWDRKEKSNFYAPREDVHYLGKPPEKETQYDREVKRFQPIPNTPDGGYHYEEPSDWKKEQQVQSAESHFRDNPINSYLKNRNTRQPVSEPKPEVSKDEDLKKQGYYQQQ